MEANTLGWIGFGLSQDGLMNSGGNPPGSDIWMAYLQPALPECESGCIHDYSTVKYEIPILDAIQNLELISFTQSSGKTTVEFKRLLNTGDTAADLVLDPSISQWILFSVQTFAVPTNDTDFSKHNYQNSIQIVFNEKCKKVESHNLAECPNADSVNVEILLNVDPDQFNQNDFLSSLTEQLGISNADSWRISVNEVDSKKIEL